MKLPGQERFENLVATALRVWLIVGILLRVTRFRDRFDGLALVFYSTPWPVIAAGFVLLALHSWRRGRGHATRRYTVFTVAALFTWVATSWYSAPTPETGQGLRLIHWNVTRPDGRLAACARWLRAQDPDIICLAEVNPDGMDLRDRWAAEFSSYSVWPKVSPPPEGNLLFLIRGKDSEFQSETGSLGPGSYYALHRAKVRGRAINILQIDISARPTRSRREPLARVVGLAGKVGGNLIIAGDWNTPRESCHLLPLRRDFTSAFEAAGRGFAETWPSFAPALSLDQVWLGNEWRALSCRHPWTWLSDHRPVVVTIAE